MNGLRTAVTRMLPYLNATGRLRHPTSDPALADRFIAASESHLLLSIDFFELLSLLPLTRWWQQYIAGAFPLDEGGAKQLRVTGKWLHRGLLAESLGNAVLYYVKDEASLRDFRLIGPTLARACLGPMVGTLQHAALARLLDVAALQVALSLLGSDAIEEGLEARAKALAARVLAPLGRCFDLQRTHTDASQRKGCHLCPLWQVSCNRDATHAIAQSRKTIKADAAIRVFDTGGQGVRWAVIDSGIDARHPALARRADLKPLAHLSNGLCLPALSRVVKTLDFTRLAAITSGQVAPALLAQLQKDWGPEVEDRLETIRHDLAQGRMLDWTAVEPLLSIDHNDIARYLPPVDGHGTHVAGIIGADWRSSTYTEHGLPVPPELLGVDEICGVCPEIELLDLRVFSANGGSNEFAILGALQYLRFLNQSKDRQYVHGVNLSLSLRHDVRNYACGSTPVCLECNRLSGSGIVVVAAAGNYGYDRSYADLNVGGAYRGQSITDPGNAASAITVGATHRCDPYQYGVSYFSSRGPTGDGRSKPDLVAPGEKVVSTSVGGTLAELDGTSMAAPHVSGAAALLLSRNNELMGKPGVIKDVLCRTASDLGRERDFQGAGLLDTLRALQAV